VAEEFKTRVSPKVRVVFLTPREEVVDTQDLFAAGQKGLAEVGARKTGSPRNEHTSVCAQTGIVGEAVLVDLHGPTPFLPIPEK
jgi:hypothetical protein